MTITLLHQVTHFSNNFHISPPTDTHFQYLLHLLQDCHTPCQLLNLPSGNHVSLTMFNKCHTFLTALPFPNGTHTFSTALIPHVHDSHFPDNLISLTTPTHPPVTFTYPIPDCILTSLQLWGGGGVGGGDVLIYHLAFYIKSKWQIILSPFSVLKNLNSMIRKVSFYF